MGEHRFIETSDGESEFTFDDHGILWHRGNAYVLLPEAAAALLKKANVEPVHLTMSQAEALFDGHASTLVSSTAPRPTLSPAAPLPLATTPATTLPSALGSGSQVPAASLTTSVPDIQLPSTSAVVATVSPTWVPAPPSPFSPVSASVLKGKIAEVVNEMLKNPEQVVQSKPLEEERRQWLERDKASARAWEALLAGPINAVTNRGAAKLVAIISPPTAVPDTPKAAVTKPVVVVDEVKKDSMS